MNSIILNPTPIQNSMVPLYYHTNPQPSHFYQSLLFNDNITKASLDDVQINSPLFLKLDIDDLLQTLQSMNVDEDSFNQGTPTQPIQEPTTPSSTLNSSTDM